VIRLVSGERFSPVGIDQQQPARAPLIIIQAVAGSFAPPLPSGLRVTA
jgi:hypothetical protein